ncbi:flavohemoglobin expression-modulating QEGLA motif protein [Patescibacteria group bacterium]|nr:flavohemoglobin expression-modulating QEGLA motif protein [Patescibacteria group bacterium]
MSLITDLIPTNLNEEKEKFFNDNTYNPQFIFEKEISQQKLSEHGLPNEQYSELSKHILEKTYFGRNEDDLFMMEGPLVSQSYVDKAIKTFLHMHQLHKKFNVTWSSSFVSRASINNETLKLRLPVDFRKEGLIGTMYHEIGTHALRNINYKQQPWFKRKKKFRFSNYLNTEEGLASLHSLIPHTYKSAFISAIRHFAVSYAQKSSFAETWKMLGKYIQDPQRRWMVTLRQKRGLTDTSKPGGFTKDLVYFEGMVETWNWLKDHNFDITNLYFGKMAKEDADLSAELNPNFTPKLPSFFTLDRKKYANDMNKIGEFNGFEQKDLTREGSYSKINCKN